MTPAARLQAVIEIFEQLLSFKRPADIVVGDYFRSRRYIGSKDRSAIATLVYTLLRHYARLNWWLDYLEHKTPTARSFAMAGLALIEKEDIDQVAAKFSGGKYAPAVLANDETLLLKKLRGHTLFHPAMPEAVQLECPDWAAPLLRQRFGESFHAEMQALLQSAPLDLRVNSLKATRDDVMEQLQASALTASLCSLSPLGIRLEKHLSLGSHDLFKQGLIEVQDEGSQLIARLVQARPGLRVLDLCAGAGGKTLALAADMKNKGRIIACDIHDKRLNRTKERLLRAGVHNVQLQALQNADDPWLKHHHNDFDRVLVDAPCSGTGTWRRNPDARWRSTPLSLDSLTQEQRGLLEQAALLTAGGGRMIYATCSVLPQENEKMVEAFLEKNQDFRPLPLTALDSELADKTGCTAYLSLTPGHHQTDGFFAAVMEKKKS